MKLNRLCVLLVALSGLVLNAPAETLSEIFSNASSTAHPAIPRRASIIFIQVDGLGYGDLSSYGQTNFQTPNLDKLAADGIRFTNYAAAAVAGSPATASLLLGREAGRLNQRADLDVPLAGDEITVAQVLKNSGYHTGLIGEWNLGDEHSAGAPWRKGFDEFAGYFDRADATNFYAGYMFRYAPKSVLNPTNNTLEDYLGREMLYYNAIGKRETYIPDLYAKAAGLFAKNNLPDPFNHYQPFFLLLNFTIPRQKIEVPTDAPFSDEPWPQVQKNQAALISRIDGYVGQLRDQLQKSGMTNNVAIFFSGAGIPQKSGGADPAFFHSVLATNDLRTPLIVAWPGNIPAGQVSGVKASAADFLPTAAEIAYTASPENVTGHSLLPVLLGESPTNRAAQK